MHRMRRSIVVLLIGAVVSGVIVVLLDRAPRATSIKNAEQTHSDGTGKQRHLLRVNSDVPGTENNYPNQADNPRIGLSISASRDRDWSRGIGPNTSSTVSTNHRADIATFIRTGNLGKTTDTSTDVKKPGRTASHSPGDVGGSKGVLKLNPDAKEGTYTNAGQVCNSPRKNLLFLKTHKTGSSTIQNIVYRYGDNHGLTFALPVSDVYMGTPSLFEKRFAIRSSSGKYNMLANHARYNRPEMDRIMYEDTAYITILRHPSTQFDSMYNFYGFKRLFGVDLAVFAENPHRYYARQGGRPMHSSLSPTLYDLGMSKPDLSDETAIRRKITKLDSDFDLILISEYLLQSLVLLKEQMCWDFNDVTYFTANARTKSKVDEMSQRTFDQLYKWNEGDAILYEHFNRTLWKRIEAYGLERMERDVRTLEKMNEALAEKCLAGTKGEKSVATLVDRYILKDSATVNKQCVTMIRPAINYLGVLRKKQAHNN